MERLSLYSSSKEINITFFIWLLFFQISIGQSLSDKVYYGTFKSANPYMMNKPLYGDKIQLKSTDRPQLFDMKDGKIKVMVNGEYGYVYADDLKSDSELMEFKNMIANGLIVLDEQQKKEEIERLKREENQIAKYNATKSAYGDSSFFIVRPRNKDVALFETPNGKIVSENLPQYEPLKVVKFYDKNYVHVRGVNDKSVIGYVMLYYVEKDKALEQWVLDEEIKEQRENERLANERAKAQRAKRLKDLTSKYGSVKANKLVNGEIWIGMTISEAVESKGEPKRINETVTANGKKQQFVYEDLYLYFEKGVLTTYQKSY